MNSRTKKQVIGGILVLAVASSTLLASELEYQQVRGPRGDNDGHHQKAEKNKLRGPAQMFAKRLNLTEEQVTKVQELQKSKMANNVRVKAEIDVKEAEMRLLWLDEKPDKAKLLAKQSEIQKIRGKVDEANIDFRLGVHAILTPEQRTAFAHFCNQQGHRGQKGQRHMKRMGKMARRGRMGRQGRRGMARQRMGRQGMNPRSMGRQGRQGWQGMRNQRMGRRNNFQDGGRRGFRRFERYETLRNESSPKNETPEDNSDDSDEVEM